MELMVLALTFCLQFQRISHKFICGMPEIRPLSIYAGRQISKGSSGIDWMAPENK